MRYAAADPGTSQNAFAFAIVEEMPQRSGRIVWGVICLRTWQGRPGSPLDTRNVVGIECCKIALEHGCESLLTDIHEWAGMQLAGFDTEVQVELEKLRPGELAQRESEQDALCFDAKVVNHERRLVYDPRLGQALIDRVTRQLGSISTRYTESGRILRWPTNGMGHGDEARAVVRALRHGRAGQPRRGGASSLENLNRCMPVWGSDAEVEEGE
jgi:hypothetical protein